MSHQGLGRGAKALLSSAWGQCFVLQGCLWDPRRRLRSRGALHLAPCSEAAEAPGNLAAGLALSADPRDLCWEPGQMRARPTAAPGRLESSPQGQRPRCDLPPSFHQTD